MTIDEYIVYRFMRHNHNKYKHYCQEWISNLTKDQIEYFKLEKERLGL